MSYFPMFVDIGDREVLVCGGGKHAMEKVERLKPFGAKIRMISEHIPLDNKNMKRAVDGQSKNGTRNMGHMEGTTDVCMERRRFLETDLDSRPVFVIAAEDRMENERIVGICRQRNIPVNAVDMQDICDFIFPALLLSGELSIGISSGGLSPAAVVELKERFREVLPDRMDEILPWMVEVREEVRRRIPDKEGQKRVLRRIVGWACDVNRKLTREEMENVFW